MIKHVWFDLSQTLAIPSPRFEELRDRLLYGVYAEATGKPLTDALKQEVTELRRTTGSNAAVFLSLGLPGDYWQNRFAHLDPAALYEPREEISDTVERMKKILPISLFTNTKPHHILRAVGIDPGWFTHIVIAGVDVKEPKPALEGFHKMVELSGVPAHETLYVADNIRKDIEPAKKVGMKTALLWQESDAADYSFQKFSRLLELFRGIPS